MSWQKKIFMRYVISSKDILSNYQGYRKCTLILVFDAYKVGAWRRFLPTNIYVVYTREAETADQYIEKTVHKIGRQYQVTVATSDGLEQVIIMGQGAHRISAQGLKKRDRRHGKMHVQSGTSSARAARPISLNICRKSFRHRWKNPFRRGRRRIRNDIFI